MTVKASVLAHLTQHGPQTVDLLTQAIGEPRNKVRNAVNKLTGNKQLCTLVDGNPQTQWYGLPDDPRSAAKRQALRARAVVPAPTAAEVRENTRRRAQEVIRHITREGVTERELTTALPELAISILRAALVWLAEDGQVVRSATTEKHARAVYRLNILDLPEPSPQPTTTDLRVERHLTQITLSGTHDTALNMASELRVSRADVERGLAALQQQGKLRCKWVGELALFRLAPDAVAVSA